MLLSMLIYPSKSMSTRVGPWFLPPFVRFVGDVQANRRGELDVGRVRPKGVRRPADCTAG